jgi:hypothetical protein
LVLAERTLYYYRERAYRYLLENSYKEDLLFGQFIELTKKFANKVGIAFDEQCMDTTMFMSNIKKADRLALAYDVLLNAVNTIPENKEHYLGKYWLSIIDLNIPKLLREFVSGPTGIG